MAKMKRLLEDLLGDLHLEPLTQATLILRLDEILKSDQGQMFKIVVENDVLPDGEYLIQTWGEVLRMAYREQVGDSWSPPLHGELITE